jgi:putative tricarboxylic transport membrane protein
VAFAGGGPATAAILGNQVAAGISGYSEFEEHIKSGKMIALASSGSVRIPGTNVPTMTELGLNVNMANWRGVFAPPGISDAQRKALVDFVTAVVKSDAWKTELTTRKWTDVFLADADFRKQVTEDITATETVMKELGLA